MGIFRAKEHFYIEILSKIKSGQYLIKYEEFLESVINKVYFFSSKFKYKTIIEISVCRIKYYIICIQRKFQIKKKRKKVKYKYFIRKILLKC